MVAEIIPAVVLPEKRGSLSGFPLPRKFMQTLYRSLPLASTGVMASCSQPPPSHRVFGENILWFVAGVETAIGCKGCWLTSVTAVAGGQAPQYLRAAAQEAGAGEEQQNLLCEHTANPASGSAPATQVSGLQRAAKGKAGHGGSDARCSASTAPHTCSRPAPPPHCQVMASSSLSRYRNRVAMSAVF